MNAKRCPMCQNAFFPKIDELKTDYDYTVCKKCNQEAKNNS